MKIRNIRKPIRDAWLVAAIVALPFTPAYGQKHSGGSSPPASHSAAPARPAAPSISRAPSAPSVRSAPAQPHGGPAAHPPGTATPPQGPARPAPNPGSGGRSGTPPTFPSRPAPPAAANDCRLFGTHEVLTPNTGRSGLERPHDAAFREVRTSGGATIREGPGGFKRVEMRQGDRVVISAGRGRVGYVQRPLVVSGRTYVQRTYVVHGVSYVHVYRPYVYRGMTYAVYTPVRYYPIGFYSWVYNPWVVPIRYRWYWMSDPWFAYYGSYFTPYPVYSSPALWLTDYLFAVTMEQAYEARAIAAAQAFTPIAQDVKQAIADEVRRQLAEERAARQNGNPETAAVPPILDGKNHVFLASTNLEVNSPAGSCWISEGDVLQLSGPVAPDGQSANATVLASKGQDCVRGAAVSISLADLQEMQNHLRATLDRGLEELQAKQGLGGLPVLPDSARGPATELISATPDRDAAVQLSGVAQQAFRGGDETSPSTPSISIGDPMDEVVRRFGRPDSIANLGARQICVFRSLKITFENGRVADVE